MSDLLHWDSHRRVLEPPEVTYRVCVHAFVGVSVKAPVHSLLEKGPDSLSGTGLPVRYFSPVQEEAVIGRGYISRGHRVSPGKEEEEDCGGCPQVIPQCGSQGPGEAL